MITLSQLIRSFTSDEVYETILSAASALGLPVTTWHAGDVTRTWLRLVGRAGAWLSEAMVRAIAGGFLDYATGAWLDLLARNGYGVTRVAATHATTVVTLTNGGGGVYVIDPGDLTFSRTVGGVTKTYRNTSGGTLNALDTLPVDVIAEEAGSASTAAAGEIDTLVTTLLGVTCSNADAAIGTDAESDDDLRARCREALAALSPMGAADAYRYIATRVLRLDGSPIAINRVRVIATNLTGSVTVVVAAPDGAPAGADVTRIHDELVRLVVPLGITPTTQAVGEQVQAITYTAYVPADTTMTDAEIAAAIEAELVRYIQAFPIGGYRTAPAAQGYLFHNLLRGRIGDAAAPIFSVTLGTPAADVAITGTSVPVLGTITPTITRVAQ